MSLTLEDAQSMQGATLFDTELTKIGSIADVYIDNDTQAPEWAVVTTGMFGTKESFVPLAQAQIVPEGVQVPYRKDQVKDAPNAEPDGELSQDEEAQLYAHYGLGYTENSSDSGLSTGIPAATAGDENSSADASAGNLDADTAMTRSEERLNVGVARRPSQTVRLHKRIVTEQVQTSVPITTERAVVTSEPITEANRDKAMDGPELTEAVHEVVLHDEQAITSKETVPVERVRLDVDSVTEQQTLTDEVRKEVIETENLNSNGISGK